MKVRKMSTADLADGLSVESLISFLKPLLMERRQRYILLDSTVVKRHQHAAGAKKQRSIRSLRSF